MRADHSSPPAPAGASSGGPADLSGRTVGIAAISLGSGGAERQAALWAEAVAACGAEVLVLALEASEQRYPLPDGARLLTVGKTGRRDTFRSLRHVRKLAGACDVIAAFQPYMGLLCLLAGARPYIVVSGQDPRQFSDTSRLPPWALGAAFRRAAAATVPSEGLIECHRRMGISPRGPWMHVPNIVDEAAFRPPADDRAGVLCVGRLFESKRPLLALRAATAAGLPITFLGDGPMREEIVAEARRLGVEDQVALPGFHPRPWEFYARHRVLLLTSRYETFANVIVEGLAAGMPVVSVDCDFGPREILRGARFSHLVGDAEPEIAAALRGVAERPVSDAETSECQAIAGRYRRSQLEPQIVAALSTAVSD